MFIGKNWKDFIVVVYYIKRQIEEEMPYKIFTSFWTSWKCVSSGFSFWKVLRENLLWRNSPCFSYRDCDFTWSQLGKINMGKLTLIIPVL